MENLQKNIASIIEHVGGKENIASATHCVTRLRLILKDDALADVKAIEENELVKGSFLANGQFQVIIGTGVKKAYEELLAQTGLTEASKAEIKEETGKKLNPLQKLIRVLADVFIPILPAIVAAGLLLGLNNILTNPGIFIEGYSVVQAHPQWADFAHMVNTIANTAFVFLPALVGWSAVKRFGGNPVLGIVLGLLMIHPNLLPAPQYMRYPENLQHWNILGLNIARLGYQGQVIPVLAASYLLATLEKFLTKKIPDIVKMLFVAPIALLVTGFLTFTIIGPVTMFFSNLLTDGILALFEISPTIAGGIFGAMISPMVVTGMHHVFLGVNLQMIGTLGYTTLWPIQVMASLGQGAAAFAIFFVTKNKKMKGVSLTAGISAWLGITEPAIFGVNLRYKFPFIASLIGAAVAGAITAGAGAKAGSIGISGIPAPLSILTEYWTIYIIAMATSIAVTMALTILAAKSKKFQKELDEE